MREKALRVSVDKLVYGGLGLAKLNGKTLLIRFAAPKELVDVEVIKEKKDYLEGVVKNVVIPSSMRREAPCPYFGLCGGCQLQHLSYDSQIEVKRETLLESLGRIGKLKDVKYLGDIPSPKEFNYRIRVQFKVQEEKLGFYAWNTKEVVDISECLLAHEEINSLIPNLREVMKAVPDLQEIHVSYSPKEGSILLKLLTTTHTDEKLLENIKENILPPKVVGIGDYARVGSTLVKRYSIGREHLFMEVSKWKYRVSNDSFFQVNYTLWEDFVKEVISISGTYRKALDLHCGVGFFTIPLSEKGNFIEGADANPSAIKDAEYNAKLNGRDNVIFREATAYNYLKKRAGEILDLVVLDPPRSGLLKEEVELLTKNKPERILYISCNPSTLARDLRMLVRGGYELEGVKLIDNFPQTYHIESIALLRVKE